MTFMCLGHTQETTVEGQGEVEREGETGETVAIQKLTFIALGNLFVLVQNELNILKFAYAKGKA